MYEKQKKNSYINFARPSINGALKVTGTNLTDSNGNTVQLKGISTHGIAWFPDYINQECFNELSSWNANVIRLAMYTSESGGYCNGGDKENLKNLVFSGVEYAKNADMYVIVDWHILSDNNPQINKEESKRFFNEISSKLSGYNNVIYEICNEPNGGTTWADIKPYALEIIPIIRQNSPESVIIVGTPTWSQEVDKAAADPITNYSNIMYTLHFYAATHKDDLRNKLVSANKSGLPVFVTEYGLCDASGNGAIDKEESEKWFNLMNSLSISYVSWNLSNKNETSSIISSNCNKKSGFTMDDLSESGKIIHDMLSGGGSISASTSTNLATSSGSNVTDNSSTGAGNVIASTYGGVSYSIKLKNSWDANGTKFYQYELTVNNNTSQQINSWQFDISLSGAPVFSDGWNGKYSVNGNTLHVSNADYNGSVGSGQQVSDIGFIISGGEAK